MDPDEMESFMQATNARITYIRRLMSYIADEWDNIPEEMTPSFAIFFNRCCEDGISIPNAAGIFIEKFIKGGE